MKPKYSIIICTKNEPYVNLLVKNIHRVIKKFSHEVIVIDKSDIPPKLEGAKLVLQKSNGLGNAVLEGLEYSKGDVIVTIDGDGSHRPIDIPRLLEAVDRGTDIAIGSKFIGGGRTVDRYHRRLISDSFRLLERFVLRIGVKDPMSGFAAIRREVYNRIKLNPLGYKINMEIMFKAKKLGYRIAEVPIVFLPRKAGKSKSTMLEGIKTLVFILKLRMGH